MTNLVGIIPPRFAVLEGQIVLRESAEYKGRSLWLSNDTPNLGQLGFNDITSSVVLGPNTYATFYADINYGGKSFKATKSVDKLGAEFNDKISSVRIHLAPGHVICYRDVNYAGPTLNLDQDTPDFTKLNFNDMLSSVKVGENTTITLYTDINYKGSSFELSKDSPWVGNQHNDKVSSIKFKHHH